MVTMADVARVAGVNASTVSHVLNGTRAVSEATREQVLQAISQTGYRRNVLARSLAKSSTMAFGVAISAVANHYLGDLVRAVESGARAAGYMLMLGDTYDQPEIERRVVEELIDRRVDGILLAPTVGSESDALPFLQSTGVPTVLLDRFADVDLDQVAPDNVEPTALLVDHLADLGHRRIAMVTGRPGLHSSVERLAGYRQVVSARGLDHDPGLTVVGGSSAAVAEQAVLGLFDQAQPPSAIVVGNNAMTIGTMRALRTLKLRVPQDVAMVCYDDFEWADLFEPRLTAMHQDVAQMGLKAIELMIQRITSPEGPTQRLRVEPLYQHRTSCGCPDQTTGQDLWTKTF